MRASERAQAQIHPVAEAVGGDLVQQPGQALSQPREIVLGLQRAAPVGLAIPRIGVDQVDVGGEVELATAQLAQAEHDQALRHPVRVAHHAMALGEFPFHRGQGDAQALLGQGGAAGQGLFHRVQAQHVAPDQPGGTGAAISPQQARPGIRIGRIQHRQRQRRRVRSGQVFEQGRLAAQGVDGEVAGHGDLGHPGTQRAVFQRGGVTWGSRAQAGQRAFGQARGQGRGGRGTNSLGRIAHRRDCGTRPRQSCCRSSPPASAGDAAPVPSTGQ